MPSNGAQHLSGVRKNTFTGKFRAGVIEQGGRWAEGRRRAGPRHDNFSAERLAGGSDALVVCCDYCAENVRRGLRCHKIRQI